MQVDAYNAAIEIGESIPFPLCDTLPVAHERLRADVTPVRYTGSYILPGDLADPSIRLHGALTFIKDLLHETEDVFLLVDRSECAL